MNMIKSIIDFNEKKGFICDMDGVIYHGNQILPGVPEFIQWLHDEKKEYLFLTNNSGSFRRAAKSGAEPACCGKFKSDGTPGMADRDRTERRPDPLYHV